MVVPQRSLDVPSHRRRGLREGEVGLDWEDCVERSGFWPGPTRGLKWLLGAPKLFAKWRVYVCGGMFMSQGSKPITFFGCSEGPEELRGGEQRTDMDLSHPWKSCCPRPLPAAPPPPKSTVSSEVGWTEPHKGEPVYIAHCNLGLCRVVECP